MTKEMMDKIVRGVIIATIFIAFIIFQGIKERDANQLVFMLAMITLFSLFLRNIWVTLFVVWTVFLYTFFKFSSGTNYLTNILFGSMLYLFTKTSFKKEHIDTYIQAFLWFVCGNLFYCVLQVLQFDFIFNHHAWNFQFNHYDTAAMQGVAGFMGHQSILATLIALAIPLLATRGSKLSVVASLGLFVPLYLCTTSLCLIAGILGFLFVMFFKMKRVLWIGCVFLMIVLGLGYVQNVDSLGTERFVQWHKSMTDYMAHPITGWGLDSYANVTPFKDFKYSQVIKETPGYVLPNGEVTNLTAITYWDNPHNLIISILYEFGFVGFFFVFMFMRKNIATFVNSIKSPNTIALGTFIFSFLLISQGHFPMYLARLSPIIICSFALFEVSTS